MDLQLLYQQDITVLEFEATIMECFTLKDGRSGVVLDRTYFYPTGGGQEHDTGSIGSARVVDVYKDDDHSRLIHVVEVVDVGRVEEVLDVQRLLHPVDALLGHRH